MEAINPQFSGRHRLRFLCTPGMGGYLETPGFYGAWFIEHLAAASALLLHTFIYIFLCPQSNTKRSQTSNAVPKVLKRP